MAKFLPGVRTTVRNVKYSMTWDRIENSAGEKQSIRNTYVASWATVPANEFVYLVDFILDGTEDSLTVSFNSNAGSGIVNIYFNDVLLDENVDLYAASTTTTYRDYTPTILPGKNVFKVVTTGKNISSMGYYVYLQAVQVY